jgi:hypothetical protein
VSVEASLDFEAMKDVVRLKYLLDFEALATVANDEDAVVVPS